MENTVVAVYDTYAHAQNAMNELLSAGFSQSDVQLSPDSNASTSIGATDTTGTTEGSGSSIGNFFRSLFGLEEHPEHGDVYSEAVRRGHCVLTVDAATEEQRDRAVDLLNRHNPVDIDERSSHWRSQGWTGYDESLPRYTDTEIEKDRSLYTQGRDMSMTENAGMNIESGIDDTQRQRDTMISGQSADLGRDDIARRAALSTGSADMTDTTNTQIEGQQRIPVVEEELRVGKREVQRGGVRVFQRVKETPVHEAVNLREEHVKVERRPVDQPASAADFSAVKEGAIELRESAEEAVVSKTARVVEEVVVGKEVTNQTKDINDTVRRTDVEVEQLGASDTNRTGSDFADTRATVDDSDFRSHWQNAYGSSGGRYEDYDAAYRYGSTLSGSDHMKNYRWQDVEPQARSDWESNHPESAWEKVKDAVRYGAERVTGKQQH